MNKLKKMAKFLTLQPELNDGEITSSFEKRLVAGTAIVTVTVLIYTIFMPESSLSAESKQAIFYSIAGLSLVILFRNQLTTLIFNKKLPLPLLVLSVVAPTASIVHFTGGITSPFFFLYILIILATVWRFGWRVAFIPFTFSSLAILTEFLIAAGGKFWTDEPNFLPTFSQIIVLAVTTSFIRLADRLRVRHLEDMTTAVKNLAYRNIQLEGERQKSKALATTLTNIGDGVFLLNSKNKIITWNKALEQMTKIPARAAVGSDWRQVLKFFDEAGKPLPQNLSATAQISYQKCEVTTGGGSHFFANRIVAPVFSQKGKFLGTAQILADAAHSRKMEKLTEISQVISSMTDLDETLGQIIEKIAKFLKVGKAVIYIPATAFKAATGQNPGWIKFYGLTEAEIEKFKNFYLYVGSPLDNLPDLETFNNKEVPKTETGRKLASIFALKHYLAVPLAVKQKVIGCLLLINKGGGGFGQHDVEFCQSLASTIATIIENAVLYQELKSSLERERRFIADVAHEFKTPLTTIRTETEVILARKRTRADYEKALAGTLNQINKLQTRLKNVLDLAWAQSLPTDQLEVVDLQNLVSEVGEIAVKLASRKKIKVNLVKNGQPNVLGVKTKLAQAIINLIDNAIKYTKAGGQIVIKLNSNNKLAKITISDTGIGIASSELPHIFDRFWQGHEVEPKSGSGLGLAITKSIIAQHKGQITAASRVGKGTKFEITMPVA